MTGNLSYVARLIKREYNRNKVIPKIHVIIIYTADVSPGTTVPMLDIGDGQLKLIEVFLTSWNADEILDGIEGKIKNGGLPSVREQLQLMMCPLSVKGTKGKNTVIRRCIGITEAISDEHLQRKIYAGILVFCDKFINPKESEKVRRYLRMTKVEQIFLREQEEAVKKAVDENTVKVTREVTKQVTEQVTEQVTAKVTIEVSESTAKRIAKNLLDSGMTKEDVSSPTGLDMNKINSLLKGN